ncbi:MAG: sensor N-terminal transmembrane domain-containing protein, partial [Pseudomonadota bacterium]
MPETDTKRKSRSGLSSCVLGSRIARLIFASNLAGLAILIVGAMVLNEMRAGFVVAKKEDLEGQAQIFSNLLNENATIGRPAPALQIGEDLRLTFKVFLLGDHEARPHLVQHHCANDQD